MEPSGEPPDDGRTYQRYYGRGRWMPVKLPTPPSGPQQWHAGASVRGTQAMLAENGLNLSVGTIQNYRTTYRCGRCPVVATHA